MKEKMRSCKWYILLLVVLLMLFSVLCWLGFARSIVSSVISMVKPRESIENSSTFEPFDPSLFSAKTTAQNNVSIKALDKLDKIPDALTKRWNNSIFAKPFMSGMDSTFTYFTTGETASSQIIRGSGEWLFYNGKSDSDPIADYEGTNLYSSDVLNEILNTTLHVQSELEQRGIEMAILFPPNKANLYSRYMPDSYKKSPVTRTGEMTWLLWEYGVNVHHPITEMTELSEQFRLYYSNDSHWNQLGAYAGAKVILDSWGIEIPELAEREIISYPLTQDLFHYGGDADLARIAKLPFAFDNELEYLVAGTPEVEWTALEQDHENGQYSHFTNENASVDATLLLVGDSFRVSMIPVLSETFSDVYITHTDYYYKDMLNEFKPDYLLVEMVERFSYKMHQLDFLI